MPVHSTKRNGYKCVCVCVLYHLLPLSKTLVSSDSTACRGGAGASITSDGRDATTAALMLVLSHRWRTRVFGSEISSSERAAAPVSDLHADSC
eukprot:COSAG01_NODE_6350_length_3719_cov_86.485912_3_plen_93_part_00